MSLFTLIHPHILTNKLVQLLPLILSNGNTLTSTPSNSLVLTFLLGSAQYIILNYMLYFTYVELETLEIRNVH